MQINKLLLLSAIALLGISACNSQLYSKFSTIQNPFIARKPENYIGLQYTTSAELKGLEFVGGAIMFGGGSVKNMYGGYTHVRQGTKNMLWLIGRRKITEHQQPIWEVLDVLSFREYDRQLNNQIYHLGWGGRCKTKNNSLSTDVIAIAVMEKKEFLQDIKQTWKINRKTGKFETYSPKNIVCENPHLA